MTQSINLLFSLLYFANIALDAMVSADLSIRVLLRNVLSEISVIEAFVDLSGFIESFILVIHNTRW